MTGHTLRMLRWAMVSASTVALGAPAHAQAYNWSGFYVGANAGIAWGRSDATTSASCAPGGTIGGYFCDTRFAASLPNGAAVSASGTGSSSAAGFTGGGQVGHLWQNGSFVYGAEADFGAFSLKTSRQGSGGYPAPLFAAAPGGAYTVTTSTDSDWLFTARGRVGWAFGNVLAFATGGVALTRLEVANGFSDTNGILGSARSSETKVGWTVGGGLEWGLSRNWSVKAEYLYLNFGSVSASGTVVAPPGGVAYANGLSTSADLTAHVARAGVNFRF